MAARMSSNNTFEWTVIYRAWLQLIVLMTVPLMALGVECSKSQELAAETEAGSLKSWAAVHRSFTRYGHCDDGAIGEGYSDSVTILLADHWDALPQLTTLAASASPIMHGRSVPSSTAISVRPLSSAHVTPLN
jgi:hypothetical protein